MVNAVAGLSSIEYEVWVCSGPHYTIGPETIVLQATIKAKHD